MGFGTFHILRKMYLTKRNSNDELYSSSPYRKYTMKRNRHVTQPYSGYWNTHIVILCLLNTVSYAF